jgi:hypothetical protein
MSEENEIGPMGKKKRGALSLTLSASDRKTFLELFRTVAEFDGYRAGKLIVKCVRASRWEERDMARATILSPPTHLLTGWKYKAATS